MAAVLHEHGLSSAHVPRREDVGDGVNVDREAAMSRAKEKKEERNEHQEEYRPPIKLIDTCREVVRIGHVLFGRFS